MASVFKKMKKWAADYKAKEPERKAARQQERLESLKQQNLFATEKLKLQRIRMQEQRLRQSGYRNEMSMMSPFGNSMFGEGQKRKRY